MDRAYSAGAIGTAPTAPVSPSIGYPTSGNPGSGVAATRPGPYWFHMITEELRALIVAAGLTPAQGTLDQVKLAVQTLIAASAPPVGALLWVPATVAPAGFLKANGALVSRSTYAALWAFAQASGNITASDAAWTSSTPGKFSPGDGSTTFRLPDLRGLFVRGYHDGSGTYETDTGRAIGSHQADEIVAHTHLTARVSGAFAAPGGSSQLLVGETDSGSTGGAETRPRNVALLPVIRY